MAKNKHVPLQWFGVCDPGFKVLHDKDGGENPSKIGQLDDLEGEARGVLQRAGCHPATADTSAVSQALPAEAGL